MKQNNESSNSETSVPTPLEQSPFIPEIWSKEMTDRFKEQLTMDEVFESAKIVLTLGTIGLTAAQVNGAIGDPATDPIIRDALIAYKAKARIMDTPEPRVRVSKVFGFKGR